MALVIGSATIATGMSPIAEAALYADPIFIDGVTFSSKYDVSNTGEIQVEKYSAANTIEATQPGSDFTDEAYSNTVLTIPICNGFQRSVKVPQYYEATMPTSVLMNKTADVVESVRAAREKAVIAAIASNAKSDSATKTAITKANIKDIILGERSALRKKYANPDVVLCSVDTYSAVLAAAGTDYTPLFNDDVVRSGRVGMWLGMVFVEAPFLDGASSYKYRTAEGSNTTVSVATVDFFMYDHNALSIIDRLSMLRVIDSENFAGSKVQCEIDTGILVTNTDCLSIKKHTAG